MSGRDWWMVAGWSAATVAVMAVALTVGIVGGIVSARGEGR